jgi:polyadenylate-binding protein
MNYYFDEPGSKQQQRKEKPTNTKLIIYLGELPPQVDQFELNQFILSKGKFTIESLYVKNTQSQSFAYVKFKSAGEALRAIKALNMENFKDYIIKAEPFKYNNQTDKTKTEGNLFIKNLPTDTTPKDLYELFNSFGTIISVNVRKDQHGENTGVGYVNFVTGESASDAIDKLNQKPYKGNILTVNFFTPREKRLENNNEYFAPMLLIKKLPDDITTDKQLNELFNSYGNVVVSGIIGDSPNERMGVVVYAKKEETENAMNALNNKKTFEITMTPIDNEIIEKVKKAKKNLFKNRYEGCNLVVKRIPKEITDKELFDIFRKFGDISSARVQTEGVMNERKDENGDVIDKEFVYVSKGCGFVLFKHADDAKKAKDELNDIDYEYKDIKMKLQVDYYDYNKGEKTKIAEIQQNMNPSSSHQQHAPYNKGGYKKKNYKTYNILNNNNNGHKGKPNINKQRYGDNNKYSNQQQQPPHIPGVFPMNAMPLPNPGQNTYINPTPIMHAENAERITVEGEGLVDKVKEKLKIENVDDRTEALGEVLFYFLLKFIPQYKLNMTEGKCSDTTLCSKLTGILIRTDVNNLLEIISSTSRLENSLRDVLLKLIQANRLDN